MKNKNVKIVTTMSQEYWDKVGQYSVTTWKKNMPVNWQLWLHDTPDIPVKYDKNILNDKKETWFNLASKECTKYQEPPGYQSKWKMFSHKSFAQWESYELDPSGYMIWCDSDVKFLKNIDPAFIEKSLQGKFCAYLGRDRVDTSNTAKRKYKQLTPETCIIIYDLEHPIAKDFFEKFKNVYSSMELFSLYSWCDAAVFEHVKSQFAEKHFNDVTLENPPAIAPLPLTFWSEYFEHWMGWTNKNARDDLSGKKEKDRIIKRAKKQGLIIK